MRNKFRLGDFARRVYWILPALGVVVLLLVYSPAVETMGELAGAVKELWRDPKAFRSPLLVADSGREYFPTHVPEVLALVEENQVEQFVLSPAVGDEFAVMLLTVQAWPSERLSVARPDQPDVVFALAEEAAGWPGCTEQDRENDVILLVCP